MDRHQADAQAGSIMGSDIARQKEIQAGLALAERVNRFSAAFALVGFLTGGVVGHAGGSSTARSALIGGLVAYFACRVVFWVLGRRAVSPRRS